MSDVEVTDWHDVARLPFRPVDEIVVREIPDAPGIHVWRRDREPVYLGEARTSLRGRLRAHLATVPDLSRSTLRAAVAVEALGVDRAVARARPPVLTVEQIAVADAWLRGCELAWVITTTGEKAHALEGRLRRERLPRLNRI